MRARRRPLPTPREIGTFLGAGLAGAIVLSVLIAANTHWSGILPGGGGFYSVWAGVREFVFQHGDPYGTAAAAQAQQLAYGGAAEPTQDPLRLDLPFFLVLLYFPLGLIADPDVARGVWATVAQMAIIAATFIGLRLVDWQPSRGSLLVVCLMALLFLPAVAALVDGTPVAVLLLVYVVILWALQTKNDELAGALAVLALCKWEVGLPFLLIVALRIVQEQRWRVAAGFGMVLTILLIVAFLVFPGWFVPFLAGTVAVIRSGHGVSTQSALVQVVPEAASKVALALTVVALALLVVELLGTRSAGIRRFSWTACLALTVTPLLGFRSEVSNLIVLVPALVVITAVGFGRPPHGGWISLGLVGALFAAPWILASTASPVSSAHITAQIFLLLPLGCLVGTYWTRWWFLRPVKTWLDEIRESR